MLQVENYKQQTLVTVITEAYTKHKILSTETILSAYTPRKAPAHMIIDTDHTMLNLHNLKVAANRNLRWTQTAARNRKHGLN